MNVIVYNRRGEVFGVGDYHIDNLADMRRAFGMNWKSITREKAYELNKAPEKFGKWMTNTYGENSHRQSGSTRTMRTQRHNKRMQRVKQMIIAGMIFDDIYDIILQENRNYRRPSLEQIINALEQDGLKCR